MDNPRLAHNTDVAVPANLQSAGEAASVSVFVLKAPHTSSKHPNKLFTRSSSCRKSFVNEKCAHFSR